MEIFMGQEYTNIVAGTQSVPLYLVQFDKEGALSSSASRAELVDAVKNGLYRDVYVFAHGWNNGFDDSLTLFKNFFEGFITARPADTSWKPVFVGVQWPSIVIEFPWEKGPKLAASDPDAAFQRQAVADIAAGLSAAQAKRFAELAARASLDEAEQREIVQLTHAALRSDSFTELGEDAPSEAELLTAWRAMQAADRAEEAPTFGFAGQPVATPQSAGLLSKLDPRNLVRTATVYTMKDRAGIIGSIAVRPLIEEFTANGASVRLIGHSYGARVMLAALSTATLPIKVRSALLLQPAVNQFCLADAGHVPKTTKAGGFHAALDQLRVPLYSTFSAKDFPLHDTFHLALRRSRDLGEVEIAAGAPPSIYCALGGYGPQGLNGGVATLQIQDSGKYEFPASSKVVALDGTHGRINGHGDVANRYTCWALVDQDQRPL
jgi:hypothetical protein